jgi:hypothetical protein
MTATVHQLSLPEAVIHQRISPEGKPLKGRSEFGDE